LLSLGFGSGYIRFYSRYKAENDEKGIAKINGMFMIIFIAISMLCIFCGAVMVFNTDLIFGTGLTDAEKSKAQVLLAIMVVNLAITFLGSVFSSYVTAHEKFFFQRLLIFLKALFNPFLTLPLLIMGYGSVSMVVITTVLSVAVFLADVIYCFKKLRMKFDFRRFEFKLLKEMWAFTFFIFINMIVDKINWSVDKFLLGRMIGTTAVAVYGVAAQLNGMYTNMSMAVSGVFVPRVNMLVAKENDNEKLSQIFAKVGRIQFIIMALIVSGYIIFGREFIHIWAGNGYDSSYIIGIFLMVPAIIPLIQNVGIEIQRAKNMHKARSVVYLLVAIVNIFVSIPCIKAWGANGAAVGTALSFFVGNGLFMNWYYHNRIGINIIFFWTQILSLLPALVAPAAVGILLRYFLDLSSIYVLGACMIVYCAIYMVSMYLFGMNKSEKEMINSFLKKIKIKGQ